MFYTRTINKNSYILLYCADLPIFTVYAVKEFEKSYILFHVNLDGEADCPPPSAILNVKLGNPELYELKT